MVFGDASGLDALLNIFCLCDIDKSILRGLVNRDKLLDDGNIRRPFILQDNGIIFGHIMAR